MNKEISQKEKIELIKSFVMKIGNDNKLYFHTNGGQLIPCDEKYGTYHLIINKNTNDLEMWIYEENYSRTFYNVSAMNNPHSKKEVDWIYECME